MISRICGRAGVVLLGLTMLPVSSFAGNSDFSAGTSFGRSNGNVTKAQMEKAGNNIGEYVPEFDREKAEQQYGGYYGGVKDSGRDMNAPGSEQFNTTEWGRAIQENKRKAPDMPGVSAGDDFLKQGQKAIDNAQSMFDPNLCRNVSYDKVTTVKKTCERDLEVSRVCQRIASVEWHGGVSGYTEVINWRPVGQNLQPSGSINFDTRPYPIGYFNIDAVWYAPDDGYVSGGVATGGHALAQAFSVFMLGQGQQIAALNSAIHLNLPRTSVKKGQAVPVKILAVGYFNTAGNYLTQIQKASPGNGEFFNLQLNFDGTRNTLEAGVIWTDTCAGGNQ